MSAVALTLPAVLRLGNASDWLAQARRQLSDATPGSRLVIAAAALTDFDSSALAVLLELRRAAGARALEICVTGLPDQLGQLAEVYGITALLPAAA